MVEVQVEVEAVVQEAEAQKSPRSLIEDAAIREAIREVGVHLGIEDGEATVAEAQWLFIGPPYLQRFCLADRSRENGQVHPPSHAVGQIEDQTYKPGIDRSSPLNRGDAPVRPAHATGGRSVTLWANYFELIPSKTQPFIRYDVAFIPEGKGEEPKGKKRARLMQLLIEQLPRNTPLASDYGSTVLTTVDLGYSKQEYLITYVAEHDRDSGENRPRYRALVQHTGTFQFDELLDYLASTDLAREKPAVKDQIIQATNIVLGHGMKSAQNIITKRNNYFPCDGNFNLVEQWMLRNGLEAFRGFFMSVRAATGRILLNVQVQHIAVWEAVPMAVLFQKMTADRMSAQEVSRAISGLWVQVSHLHGRLKRIAGLATPLDGRKGPRSPIVPAWGANAQQTQFWKDNDAPPKYAAVADYFEQTYRTLSQPKLPVVNVGTRDAPSYLPMEVCTVRRMQDYTKKLSPEATAEMIKFAVRRAPDNARTISGNGMALLQHVSGPRLESFGVQIKPSMITVSGRILSGVSLNYSGSQQAARDASWNMKNVKFSKGATLPMWSFLWVRTTQTSGSFARMTDVVAAVDRFQAMMLRCGIIAPKPLAGKELLLENVHDPEPEIERFFSTIRQISLVLVILPFQSTPIYNAIKKAGDIKFGIHTVDVVAEGRKFAKMGDNSQYFANVALKFNLKFGGQNQLLRNADLGFVAEGKTMLVGLDVTHPAPGSTEAAPSVSSITASVDAKLAQWPADVAIQERRQEMVEGLKEMLISRLKLWQSHNEQRLPEEIIVYRDGVGETMYDLVRTVEIPQMRAACIEIYPASMTKADQPFLTVIICGKRIKTRFYPTDEAEQDERTGGTKSGTVVDRSITETRIWDFYLQAHTALQGTPKPAHYVVVHDEIFRRRAFASKSQDNRTAGQRAADDLERLTHALCYMYGRATKAVSICPPAYYADLVCDRARRWLSGVFDGRTAASSEGGEVKTEDVKVHDRLKDSMFYI